MSSKKQIKDDVPAALKQGDEKTSTVLRMALANITTKEKEKRYKISKDEPNLAEEELQKKSELAEDEIISVISSEIKKRKDAIVLYEKGNRQELADKEKEEIKILQKYLPEQLSTEELEKLIQESINKVSAKEMKDMGKVMADLAPKIKGKADNSQVSRIIKEALIK